MTRVRPFGNLETILAASLGASPHLIADLNFYLNSPKIFGGQLLYHSSTLPTAYPFLTNHAVTRTMELSSPHLLTKLPRSSRPGGSVSFARVTAVRGGITKHRNEICAAIHGDSLTLYNVIHQTPCHSRLLTDSSIVGAGWEHYYFSSSSSHLLFFRSTTFCLFQERRWQYPATNVLCHKA